MAKMNLSSVRNEGIDIDYGYTPTPAEKAVAAAVRRLGPGSLVCADGERIAVASAVAMADGTPAFEIVYVDGFPEAAANVKDLKLDVWARVMDVPPFYAKTDTSGLKHVSYNVAPVLAAAWLDNCGEFYEDLCAVWHGCGDVGGYPFDAVHLAETGENSESSYTYAADIDLDAWTALLVKSEDEKTREFGKWFQRMLDSVGSDHDEDEEDDEDMEFSSPGM